MRDLTPEQQELGLRATRLMALQTQAEPQWAFADFRARQDDRAALGLIDWIRGMPQPAR
jgi:hypothetical protein